MKVPMSGGSLTAFNKSRRRGDLRILARLREIHSHFSVNEAQNDLVNELEM